MKKTLGSDRELKMKKPSPIITLWMYRILISLGGHHEFITNTGFHGGDELPRALGLDKWTGLNPRDHDQKQVLAAIRQLHAQAEDKFHRAIHSRTLTKNLNLLAELASLTKIDCRILELAVLVHTEPLLNSVSELLGLLSPTKVEHIFSVLLDIPEKDIRTALSPQGILSRSGLLSIDLGGTYPLRHSLNLLPNFAGLIQNSDADPITLLKSTVSLSCQPILGIKDFSHIDQSLSILLPYLRKAMEARRAGVNFLIYGAPGTGKTQLARVIAQELGSELFEVASEDIAGDPTAGVQRLCAFRAAQCFFAHRKALILFDEVEDVFNDVESLSGSKSTAQKSKAWINRMLDGNPVPTMWVSNSVECLDPAFVRRFDMVIELPIPPKRQQERIIREACRGMLPESIIKRISDAEMLSPAVIERAVSVVRSIQRELPEKEISKAVEHLIGNTMKAQGHSGLNRDDAVRLPEFYDPAFINAGVDLGSLAQGIVKSKNGRVCLYGPPGTGKTAFGRWLADQLDVPLHVKRASDLISMWVGGTEKNIAEAFRRAAQDEALLLIDEVDSFLQDRRGAQQSWEVSQVNEMLTQMESFQGVFIASTNLMGGLDQAALRRFDLKVKFDFLRPEQAWRMLQKQCSALGIEEPSFDLQARMNKLALLTPGDFAAVARQHRFRPITSAIALVEALESECGVKEGHKPAVGFY